MIHTYAAYGFKLSGPGSWAFTGVESGGRLVVLWYDATNPTHDFAARATTEIARGLHHELSLRRRIAYEIQTPFFFESVIDVSPQGWTREANAPPALQPHLPASSPLLDLDRPQPASYVLVLGDSVSDLDAIEAAYYDEDDETVDEEFLVHDARTDWDSLFGAALTEIGVQMPDMPDWFWYRTEPLMEPYRIQLERQTSAHEYECLPGSP
ncbi:hypothetical protein Ait01nite_059040 [Actinoplanes italicus]|uniref:Uncharacterized protein n=1 Tax=Actinoplanes italicus TaxID=113567 RepID=A0A2T0K6M1_9ACTN|nr:hypothetical protein [Actinoplanes italicus]PRX18446.1 hypothetical protein CLV67_113283 [Actinoplanes italicus]GIE32859.1 hypothetical protein Ait01nite_059040 [Actinoplanes italicus]